MKLWVKVANPNLPISLLAFTDAGYKTLHLSSPCLGSSDARTLAVAEIKKAHILPIKKDK